MAGPTVVTTKQRVKVVSGGQNITTPAETQVVVKPTTPKITTPAATAVKVDGTGAVAPALHAPTHLPSGSDPLTMGTPLEISDATNTPGSAEAFANAEHVHAHGNRAGGGLHAVATVTVAGFMSAADKTALDAAVPSSRDLTAGAGMTGGGDLSSDRTFNVIANADLSIVVNADDIQVGVLANDGQHGTRGGGAQHAVATVAVNGFMSAADKTALDAHLVNVSNPHAVTRLQARIAGGRGALNAYVESDFFDPGLFAEGVQAIAAGAGAGVGSSAGVDKTDHPGVWGLQTGTTTTGRIFIIGSSTRGFHFGVNAGPVRCGSIIMIGTASTAAQAYVFRAGIFSIVLPNTILFGVGFEYQHDQNGGRWQGITADVGESSLDTGITVVANTWYNLEFEVNALATSVEFFIDGVSVGILAVVADIPGGSILDQFYNTHIMKLAGTANRASYIDYYYLCMGVSRG